MNIKELKNMAICHLAALEYDHVPEGDKVDEVNELLGTEITLDALNKYSGGRHDEISRQITDEILDAKIGEFSDGYHTFDELYEHRCVLHLALCKSLITNPISKHKVWKSKIHSDGTLYAGWFVLGIDEEAGTQITYHLPEKYWDSIMCRSLEKAPEFDGHSSKDVLERLMNL